MRSVGIVTLIDNNNYGNRLQNFALQEVLRSLGFRSVTTIKSAPRIGEGGRMLPRRISHFRERGFRVVLPWVRDRLGGLGLQRGPQRSHLLGDDKKSAIGRFTSEHIQESANDFSDPLVLGALSDSCDYFVAGSDQIWNPEFGLRDHLRFLSFADSQKRVAYSASIGVAQIPGHLKRAYREGVTGMAQVSVRETRAAELIARTVGRQVPVTLDPTMLLPAARWSELAVIPPSLRGGGYVAEFFLGPADLNSMAAIREYARKEDLASVNLREDPREDLRALGPLELLGAIQDASLVVTDSFHVTVFATLFHVPFLLRGRGEMNSRFDTLLSKSGLEMPKWQTLEELRSSIDIDWDQVQQNLARERSASMAFLRSAFPARKPGA